MKEAAPLSNRHAMKYRNPVANPGYLSRAAGNRTLNKRPLGISIGITLILIVHEEQCFDARVSNIKYCCWYHSIRREVHFLVLFANLYYSR